VGPAGIHTGRGQLAPLRLIRHDHHEVAAGQANDLNDGAATKGACGRRISCTSSAALSKVTKWQAQQVNAHHAAECRHCIIPEAHRGRCP